MWLLHLDVSLHLFWIAQEEFQSQDSFHLNCEQKLIQLAGQYRIWKKSWETRSTNIGGGGRDAVVTQKVACRLI